MEPTKILKTEYEELHNAVENGKHDYHCFYLATVSFKTPRLRTVVLRSFDKDENSISFHTDLRSKKIKEMRTAHENGKWYTIEECRKCDHPYIAIFKKNNKTVKI